MSRWDRHPAAQALTEESVRVQETAISSSLVTLGKSSAPHIYITTEPRAFIEVIDRGVTHQLAMSPAQLRSIVGQGERVLHAYDLRDSA